MKILVDQETKQILGASLLGLSGDEVIHCILDTMYAKAPSTVLQRAMHIPHSCGIRSDRDGRPPAFAVIFEHRACRYCVGAALEN